MPRSQSGTSIQYWMILAPAMASKPTMMTPEKPIQQADGEAAQLPSALRA